MVSKFALLAAAALCFTSASASQLPDYPFIHVSGSATTYVMPDIGTIDFEIVAVDADPAAARDVIESRVAEVRALMEQQGLQASDVEVRDVRQEQPKGDGGGALLYELRCAVHVNVREIAKWTAFAGGLLGKANLTAFATAFDTSEREKIEADLMAQATRDAQRRAQSIAAGFGRKLGPVTGVTPGALKNLANAMGLVATDFTYRRDSRAQRVDNREILTIKAFPLVQSVDVVFRFK